MLEDLDLLGEGKLVCLQGFNEESLGLLLKQVDLGQHHHVVVVRGSQRVVEVPDYPVFSPETPVDLLCILVGYAEDPRCQVAGEPVFGDEYEHHESGAVRHVRNWSPRLLLGNGLGQTVFLAFLFDQL